MYSYSFREHKFQILFFIFSAIIISYLSVNLTNYTFVIFCGALILFILIISGANRLPIYFLLTYVVWGELLYSIFYLYLTKRYGIPAGFSFDIPLLVVIFIFIIQKISNPEKWRYDGLDILISIFLFLIFLHLLNGMGKHTGIFNQTRGFFFYFLYFPFVYYFSDLKEIDKIKKLVLWISVIFSIFAVMDALGLLLKYQYKILEGNYGVVQKWGLALRFHTIEAVFAITFFFLLLALLRNSKHSKLARMFIIFLICFMVIIILYSLTRSYQLGFLVSIFIYICIDIIFLKKVKLKRYFFFGIVFLGIIISSLFLAYKFAPNHFEFVKSIFSQRWDTSFIEREKSLGRRFDEITFFSKFFIQKPVFGYGIGKEQLFFARDRLAYNMKRYIMISGPHNELIYYLYSIGLVGTILYLSILTIVLKRAISNLRFLRSQKNLFYYHLQASMLTIIITFMIISNADWRFRRAHDVVWIALFYALTRNISRLFGENGKIGKKD